MATALAMLTDPGNPEANGRMVHMLSTAVTLREAGDDVAIYFHGAGVNWAAEFFVRESPFSKAYGEKFDSLKSVMKGFCNFCANVRFEQSESIAGLGLGVIGAEGDHHTEADLILAGDRVVTY